VFLEFRAALVAYLSDLRSRKHTRFQGRQPFMDGHKSAGSHTWCVVCRSTRGSLLSRERKATIAVHERLRGARTWAWLHVCGVGVGAVIRLQRLFVFFEFQEQHHARCQAAGQITAQCPKGHG